MLSEIKIVGAEISKNNLRILVYYVCDYRGRKRVFLLSPLIDKQIVLWINSDVDNDHGLGWDDISILDECDNIKEVAKIISTFYM